MNESTLKEKTKRLLEVNEIIKKLDETIRPAAFSLLQGYVSGGAIPERESQNSSSAQDNDAGGREEFFSKFSHDKPADNVKLLSAYLYSQYGTSPFSMEEIKKLANDVGVTVPGRPDMTFVAALEDGKHLFQRGGRGEFRPTVYGEAYFKKTYQVSKGKQQKPQGA